MSNPILSVSDLQVTFKTPAGELQAVRGVDFDLREGEMLGIVGESGSGKSVTCMSLLGLNPDSAKVVGDAIQYRDQNLLSLSTKQLRTLRGDRISMIFQDPGAALNPLMTVGNQVGEVLQIHRKNLSRDARKKRVVELLDKVRIPEPEQRAKQYPHELSGGMRQRVMVAMALACDPDILIADEPTTALDVTIQKQILDLLSSLREEFQMSVIFITHDLGVVAELCDRVIVMYGGLVMEEAPISALMAQPAHPYAKGLLACSPAMDHDRSEALEPIPGSPPDMISPPPGCPFAPRCEVSRNVCHEQRPELLHISPKRSARCWLLSAEAPAEIRLPIPEDDDE